MVCVEKNAISLFWIYTYHTVPWEVLFLNSNFIGYEKTKKLRSKEENTKVSEVNTLLSKAKKAGSVR